MLLLDHFPQVNFIKEPYALRNYQDISLYKSPQVYERIQKFPSVKKPQIVSIGGGSNMGNLLFYWLKVPQRLLVYR